MGFQYFTTYHGKKSTLLSVNIAEIFRDGTLTLPIEYNWWAIIEWIFPNKNAVGLSSYGSQVTILPFKI